MRASASAELVYAERPAAGTPAGLLVLHHGRGTDEHDLLGLAEALDPAHRLHVAAPRAPLKLPGSPGYHWYLVPRVGHPDPATFAASYDALASFHDELWERTGIAPRDTVLGGFSMGTVMSYALGLGRGRPTVAGILAFSGFIPEVSGWEPSLPEHAETRVFVAHGRNDPVIDVSFARKARDILLAAGIELEYCESAAGHYIDAADVARATSWLSSLLAARSRDAPGAT
jgi:phospholipase/carboxylesterase